MTEKADSGLKILRMTERTLVFKYASLSTLNVFILSIRHS